MSREQINTLPIGEKLKLLNFILDNSDEALSYAINYYNSYGVDNIKFSPPNPNKCEGYWTKTKNNTYLPTVSNQVWRGKNNWLEKAFVVNANTPTVAYRGIAFSRLDGSPVGNQEFQDETNNICWPEGYIEHYIQDHNVMPTEKFYQYVNSRYNEIKH